MFSVVYILPQSCITQRQAVQDFAKRYGLTIAIKSAYIYYKICWKCTHSLYCLTFFLTKRASIFTDILRPKISTVEVLLIHILFTKFCFMTQKLTCGVQWNAFAKTRMLVVPLCDATASYLLEFLVSDVHGYLAGWLHVKLYAKCTFHCCYRLLASLTAPTPVLCGSHFQS